MHKLFFKSSRVTPASEIKSEAKELILGHHADYGKNGRYPAKDVEIHSYTITKPNDKTEEGIKTEAEVYFTPIFH